MPAFIGGGTGAEQGAGIIVAHEAYYAKWAGQYWANNEGGLKRYDLITLKPTLLWVKRP